VEEAEGQREKGRIELHFKSIAFKSNDDRRLHCFCVCSLGRHIADRRQCFFRISEAWGTQFSPAVVSLHGSEIIQIKKIVDIFSFVDIYGYWSIGIYIYRCDPNDIGPPPLLPNPQYTDKWYVLHPGSLGFLQTYCFSCYFHNENNSVFFFSKQ
jgi:hypothetical protein